MLGLSLPRLSLLLLLLTASCSKKPPSADRMAPAKGASQKVDESSQAVAADAPDHTPASTSSVEPDKAAETDGKAPRRRYSVAALGDSITDYRSGGGGYLRVLERACPQSQFDNFGKGGDMTNQMLHRFERDIVPRIVERGYTTLIVYGGVNDLYSNLTAGRTNDRIQADLSRIYTEARDAGLEVVAITVSPWGGFKRYFNAERSQNTRLLNSWILGGPSQKRVSAVVDSYPLLSCGDPEVLCPEYETRHHDGLHPGEAGHTRLGELLLDKVFADCE